jgi:hypothetical protein
MNKQGYSSGDLVFQTTAHNSQDNSHNIYDPQAKKTSNTLTPWGESKEYFHSVVIL